jgi:hypothetical protein
MEGQASGYGVMPWYWYLQMLCAHLGPLAVLVLLGMRRSPFLGWITLVILASHSVLAHKEVRFLYPLVPLAITLAALGIMEVVPVFNQGRKIPLSSRTIVVGGLGFCLLSSCLLNWNFEWSRMSGSLAAFDQLSRESTVCGVGAYKIDWWDIGGYTHLHKNVPIILLGQPSELKDQVSSFNAVVSAGKLADLQDGFKLNGCWNGVCQYLRPGTCTPPRGDNEINRMLLLLNK